MVFQQFALFCAVSFVRTMRGENAHITRPGYIEYDYFDPCDLKPSLETKVIQVCFCWAN